MTYATHLSEVSEAARLTATDPMQPFAILATIAATEIRRRAKEQVRLACERADAAAKLNRERNAAATRNKQASLKLRAEKKRLRARVA